MYAGMFRLLAMLNSFYGIDYTINLRKAQHRLHRKV